MDGRDSVRKKLESCGLLFGQGHFIECSRKLRSIDVHSFSPLSLALEHNVSVCNIMLLLHGFKSTDISPSVQAINTKQDQWECNAKDITCSQSTGSGLLDAGKMVGRQHNIHNSYDWNRLQIAKAVESLKKVLCKVYGLPITELLLTLECITVYNICYLQMLESTRTYCVTTSHDACVQKCFYRVHRFIGMGNDVEENIEEIASFLLKSRFADEVKGSSALLLIFHYLQKLTAEIGNRTSYLELLHTIHQTMKHVKLPSYLLSFPLLDTGQNDVQNLESIALNMVCSALYMEDRYGECEEVLGRSANTSNLPENMYLTGCVLYKLKKYPQCINELNILCEANIGPRLKAMAYCCMGNCLANQGAVHSSIQHCKRSLEHDFTYTSALYSIAEQYRQLSMIDAELESLKMLIDIIQGMPRAEETPYIDLTSLLTSMVEPIPKLSLAEAIHHMSTRCFQLKRFDVAAERYLDLLNLLTTGNSDRSVVCHSKPVSLLKTSLPSLQKIFLETARALISCSRYEDAIAVCDELVTKCAHEKNKRRLCSEEAEGPSTVENPSEGSRKRTHSEEKAVADTARIDEVGDVVVATKYKGEAFYKMGRLKDALDCMNRTLDLMETSGLSLNSCVSPPSAKKVRLGSEADELKTNHVASFVAEAHVLRAVLQGKLDKTKSALTSVYCALQVLPDDSLANFLSCLLLLKDGDERKAVANWLKYRNLSMSHIDTFHLHNLLDRKYSRFRNKDVHPPEFSDQRPTDIELEIMDVICLRKAQTSMQRGSAYL